MKTQTKITITPSVALEEMGLMELIGRSATIVEILERPDGTIRGCWAALDGEPYQGEEEWFIPFSSFVQ